MNDGEMTVILILIKFATSFSALMLVLI